MGVIVVVILGFVVASSVSSIKWYGGVARSSMRVLEAFTALSKVSGVVESSKKSASSLLSSSVVGVVVGFVVVVVAS